MSEFTATRMPIARKEYECGKCHCTIDVGDMYNYDVGRDYDHGFYVQRFCSYCYPITEQHKSSRNDMEYIRRNYKVPALKGGKVKFEDKPGTIVGARGAHLRIKLDGESKAKIYHPTWHIEYLEAN